MDSLGTQGKQQLPGRSSVDSVSAPRLSGGVAAVELPRTAVGPVIARPKASESHLSVVPPPAPVTRRVTRRRTWYQAWGKRGFDLTVSASILFALAPVMFVVWAVLRVALGRDVVITQDRVGKDGLTFGMFKFRTMHWSRRGRALPYDGPDRRLVHKTDNDPRHTRVGRAFRKASLDELPQLINVLMGDMSLVGPRPELAEIVDRIGERGHGRHSVRPGMTGEWQITGRQDGRLLHECFDEDLPYLDRVTLRNDLAILFRTVSVVTGRGGR